MLKLKLENNSIIKIIISNPKKGEIKKIIIENKTDGKIFYQSSEFQNNMVVHKNIFDIDEIFELIQNYMLNYKQLDFICTDRDFKILIDKNLNQKIIMAKEKSNNKKIDSEHNRKKNYILPEGTKIDFLIHLGVMDENGKVFNAMQKKFRQINRFLEFIDDIEKYLDNDGIIIDFGCGKSYLTFALYYYLNVLKNKNIHIIGLDLKADVISKCNNISEILKYDKLKFFNQDIKDFETHKKVNMVITLHACDTATDYALFNAVKWGAKVIMSVPCCQHEINSQIENKEMDFILKYGVLKERFSALMTDALRAEILSSKGYKTDILEFIDMEHTPKNLMIRAVFTDKKYNPEFDLINHRFNISPTLYELFKN